MLSFSKIASLAVLAAVFAPAAQAWTWDKQLGTCDCSGHQTFEYKCCYQGQCDDGTTCRNEGTPTPSPISGTQTCTPDAAMCSASTGGVKGDPQFSGLRGGSYQIHGIDGFVYNIISARDLQMNAQFTFLNSGKCPIMNGKRAQNCYSHPGSYIGALGLRDEHANKYYIGSGDYQQGFVNVTYNDEPISAGQTQGNLQFVSSHEIKYHSEQFDFVFQNSDKFINQEISVNKPISQVKAHGLLGVTASGKTFDGKIKYIEGEVSDYVVEEGNVFGDNIVFNAYN